MKHQLSQAFVKIDTARVEHGLIRPIRQVYIHVGKPIASNFRDLTPEEHRLYGEYDYYKFEEFGPEKQPRTGSFWRKDKFDRVHYGCGNTTRISIDMALNFAHNPTYYRSAYCSSCHNHFRIGETGEFVWEDDNTRVGL